MTLPKIAVMASGGGRHLRNLLVLSRSGELPIEVVCVLASKVGIGAQGHAREFGVPTYVEQSESISSRLESSGADWVVMAGWLRKWDIPASWMGRALNIHPSLLPLFGGKGYYGNRVHEAVLASGMRVSGCSVHFVTQDYDTGPLIVQRTCEVLPVDTVATLASRVFEEELKALPEAIRLVVSGRVKLEDGRTVFRA